MFSNQAHGAQYVYSVTWISVDREIFTAEKISLLALVVKIKRAKFSAGEQSVYMYIRMRMCVNTAVKYIASYATFHLKCCVKNYSEVKLAITSNAAQS